MINKYEIYSGKVKAQAVQSFVEQQRLSAAQYNKILGHICIRI